MIFADRASPGPGKPAVAVLKLVDRETRAVKVIASMPEGTDLINDAITPDGRTLYEAIQMGRSDVWLMTLGEEPKR